MLPGLSSPLSRGDRTACFFAKIAILSGRLAGLGGLERRGRGGRRGRHLEL